MGEAIDQQAVGERVVGARFEAAVEEPVIQQGLAAVTQTGEVRTSPEKSGQRTGRAGLIEHLGQSEFVGLAPCFYGLSKRDTHP